MDNLVDKPHENKSNWRDEANKCRSRLLDQIYNIKETFKSGIRRIEDDFTKSYDIYYKNLIQKLKEYDILIEQHIVLDNSKNQCYTQMNNLLKQILENKISLFQSYINQIAMLTQQLLDNYVEDEFPSGVDFIKKMIELQKKEKENEELNIYNEKLKNYQNSKNKPKIEINGDKNESENRYEIDSSKVNYEKITVKKLTKERFELLFSQINSIYSKLHNENQLNNRITERSSSIYSVSGEPAPNVFIQPNNQANMQKNFSNQKITDISIKDSTLEDINFADYFPYIENLKIINSRLSYNIQEQIKFQKLETLKLEGIGLINENFNPLFDQIRKNEMMRKNLRVLSVKNNNISFLDYKKGYADNILKTMAFNNLEILDMSYNKLYLFQNQIFNTLDKISLIDLTNNNIAFPTKLTDLLKAAKSKKCLVLMTNNLAILKEKANIIYNEYLIQILPLINYPVNNITLDNIFCSNNFKYIKAIEIGKFKDSLEYLNLSNGNLRDNDLIQLLNEKWHFPYLKYFILESNYLTEEFLYSLINNEYNFDIKLSNLKVFNLSENEISCSDANKFKQFLELFTNLEILELKFTPIEKCINQVFKKKVIEYHDNKKQRISEYALDENEKKIAQIIDNNYLKEKTKVTIKIVDFISAKYRKTIVTHLSYLLDRIVLENRLQS